MAITTSLGATAQSGASAVSSVSASVTVNAGGNRYLLFELWLASTTQALPAAPTVTYDGTNVPLLWSRQKTVGGYDIGLYTFGLVNPSAGAGKSYSAQNFGGSFTYAACIAQPCYNVNSTTPIVDQGGDADDFAQVGSGRPVACVGAGGNSLPANALLIGALCKVHSSATTNAYSSAKSEPTFIGTTGVTTEAGPAAAATTGAIALPPSVNGALLLCIVRHRNTNTTSCATSGWSKVSQITTTSFSLSVFKAVRTPSLAAPTVTWSGSVVWKAEILSYAYADDCALLANQAGTASPALDNGAFSTKANATAVCIVATNSAAATFGTLTQGAAYVQRTDSQASTNAIGHFGVWDDQNIGGSGTASGIFSLALGASAAWATMSLEVWRQGSTSQSLFESKSGFGVSSLAATNMFSQTKSTSTPQSFACELDATAGHTTPATAAIWTSSYLQNLDAKTLTPTGRFDNAQTFYAPTVKQVLEFVQSARFDNAQDFYAPTVSLAVTTINVTPSLHTNAQTFYAPKIKATFAASLHTNAQTFNAPKIAFRVAQTARLDNAQAFYTPTKLSVKLAIAARHDNAQNFFGPKVRLTVKPSLHTNAQGFFGPKISARIALAARHDNAQQFFAPKVRQTVKAAARFDNAQTFYAPSVKRAPLTPSLFTNAQQFFGPKIALTVKATARFDNVQTFYDPTITRASAIRPTRHDNVQGFFAPTRQQRLVALGRLVDNAQTFYPAKIAARIKASARFDNVQTFYAPAVFRVGAAIQAPPFVNAQQFFAPSIKRTVVQTGGTPTWDASGSYVLDTEYVGAHYVTPLTLVQDAAGNLTGVGGSAPYTWTINSGSVSGNTFEFWSTYDSLVINQHHVGTIAPDGTLSGTWDDDYTGGRTGSFTTTSGAAVASPSGAGFVNAQQFYSPRVAPQKHAAPSLHTNTQIFYPPAIRLTLKPGRVDNVQDFFAPSLRTTVTPVRFNNAQTFGAPKVAVRVTASRFDNAQQFFAPSIRTTVKVAARHTNTQDFFGPSIRTTLAASRHDNAQTFFAPRLMLRLAPARFDNAQAFFGPELDARRKVGARFDNAQNFFGPQIALRYKVGARFDNVQAFYPPTLTSRLSTVRPPFHINTQEFFSAAVHVVGRDPALDAVREFDAFTEFRFEFGGRGRVSEFSAARRTEFESGARVSEFTQQRPTVFRSRLIVEGELIL